MQLYFLPFAYKLYANLVAKYVAFFCLAVRLLQCLLENDTVQGISLQHFFVKKFCATFYFNKALPKCLISGKRLEKTFGSSCIVLLVIDFK